MRLLRENKPAGAWYIYDGGNHGVYAFLGALAANKFLPFWAAIIVSILIVGLFVYLEHSQETAMVDKDPSRKYHFSQRRWQDIGFAVVGVVLAGVVSWIG